MALPAHLLQRLPPAVLRHVGPPEGPQALPAVPLGVEALDQALPEGGLVRGGVVELAVQGAPALATRIALLAVSAVQAEGAALGGEVPWCAFVDPHRSLHAPAVAELGVVLERLLVVRPPAASLARIAVRLVEAQAWGAVVLDAAGLPGREGEASLGPWARVVRRMSQAVVGTGALVLLLTQGGAQRPLPLPVAQRVELVRRAPGRLALRIAKDRQGRLTPWREVEVGSELPVSENVRPLRLVG